MEGCLLCLEISKDILDSIPINSEEWQAYDIGKLIVKHLWPIVSVYGKIKVFKYYKIVCVYKHFRKIWNAIHGYVKNAGRNYKIFTISINA